MRQIRSRTVAVSASARREYGPMGADARAGECTCTCTTYRILGKQVVAGAPERCPGSLVGGVKGNDTVPVPGWAQAGRLGASGSALRCSDRSVRSSLAAPSRLRVPGGDPRTYGRGREPWPGETRRCTDFASFLHCRFIAATLARVLS